MGCSLSRSLALTSLALTGLFPFIARARSEAKYERAKAGEAKRKEVHVEDKKDKMESEDTNSGTASLLGARVRCRNKLSLKLASNNLPYLIRSNFIKTTYDISLDSQISFLPLGFSPLGILSPSES